MFYVFIYVIEYYVIKYVVLCYNNKLLIEKEYKINFFFKNVLRNFEKCWNF